MQYKLAANSYVGILSAAQLHGAAHHRAQTQDLKSPTGGIKVSDPETTAWDMVRYFKAAGGLDNVATVLSELAEKLDADKLRRTVKRHNEIIVAQRLGYLLDQIGRRDLSKGFADWVKTAPLRSLDPAEAPSPTESRKWHLSINARVEPEA